MLRKSRLDISIGSMISGGLVCGALRSSIMREVWRDLAKGPQSRTISFMFSSQRAWKLFENAVSAYLNERPYGSLNAIEEALFARRQVKVDTSHEDQRKANTMECIICIEICRAGFVIFPTLWYPPASGTFEQNLSKPMCHILVSYPCCENFY